MDNTDVCPCGTMPECWVPLRIVALIVMQITPTKYELFYQALQHSHAYEDRHMCQLRYSLQCEHPGMKTPDAVACPQQPAIDH